MKQSIENRKKIRFQKNLALVVYYPKRLQKKGVNGEIKYQYTKRNNVSQVVLAQQPWF